jgi:hypothetical protein
MSIRWTNLFWAGSLDLKFFILYFETFCEDAPRNKLCRSINFVLFGPIDQKLRVFEVFRRSLGRAGICCSQ